MNRAFCKAFKFSIKVIKMKWIGVSVCALTCGIALSLPCIAQANPSHSNPWNGSWKLDAGSEKYEGPTFSMKTDPDGFTLTRYGKASPKMICDGKPQPDSGGMVAACTKSGSTYTIDETKGGKPVAKVTLTLSDGGKMGTRVVEVYPAGEPSYQVITGAKRVSGGSGWDGTWKEVSFKEPADSGVLAIQVQGDMIAFKETDSDKPIMCKLDGTPSKFGDRLMAVKLDGPHTLKVTYMGANGKVQRSNTFALSPDGKKITETDLTPAPSPSTMTMTFHKS